MLARLMIFVYGTVTYVLFLGIFLYLTGFPSVVDENHSEICREKHLRSRYEFGVGFVLLAVEAAAERVLVG